MYTLNTSLLLFALLSLAAAEQEPRDCLGEDKTMCESLASAVQQEDSPQGLEMLQLKGTRRTRKCPVPDLDKFKDGGKSCFQGEPPPGQDEACIGGNKEFDYMEDAWKACGENSLCGAVMQTPSGRFLLRRLSDPDQKGNDGSRLYTYNCQESVQEHTGKQKEAQTELKNGRVSKKLELKVNESVMQEEESDEEAEKDSEEEEDSEDDSEEDSEEASEDDSEEGEEEGEEDLEVEESGQEVEDEEEAQEDLSFLQQDSNVASEEEAEDEYVEDSEGDAEEETENDAEEEGEEEAEKESDEEAEQSEEETGEESDKEADDFEEEAQKEADEDEAEEESEEKRLHLLQLEQEDWRAVRLACPLPEKTDFRKGGKSCPHPGKTDNGCLNENKGFKSLEDAWKACAEEEFCGAVIESWDKRFFMRRATDPDMDSEYQKTYMFPCKQQELQYKLVMEKAKAKAEVLMKHVHAVASEKNYEKVHDAQLMAKAEEEEVRKAADRHQKEMINEQHQAQERLKQLKMDYEKSEKDLAKQEKELAEAEVMLKPVEQHAGEYAGELEKSVNRLNDAGMYRAEYETKLKDLDEAKYQEHLATHVAIDAKDTLAAAKKDIEYVKKTEGKRLKEAQSEAKQATDEAKSLEKRERLEKKELAKAQQELKEMNKAVVKQEAKLKAKKTHMKKNKEDQAP